MLKIVAATLSILAVPLTADAFQTPAPDGARVYVVEPRDGATVGNPVTVVFGLENLGVAPAGVEADRTGHHHLLINVDPSEVDMTAAIPADDRHVHFGGGQTQITKELPPGTHRLWLLVGDRNHVPHDPPIMSEPITITVE